MTGMIAVGITTAPRPGECYLERTVHSLLDAGFPSPTIFAEPHSPVTRWVDQICKVIWRPRRLGEWANRVKALQELQDASVKLMVEDDVVFCCRVRERLEADLWPSERCGAIHVYTSRRYRDCLSRGLSRLPKRLMCGLSGACAMAFRPEAAIEVVGHARAHGWKSHERTDQFFGTALSALNWEAWCYNPSLGFHIGVESVSGHGGPHGSRREIDFPGEDADAIALFSE